MRNLFNDVRGTTWDWKSCCPMHFYVLPRAIGPLELLTPAGFPEMSFWRYGTICARWHYQMETFFALLALCEGNLPVTGGLPSQRPMTRSFDFLFVPQHAVEQTMETLVIQCVHYDVTVMGLCTHSHWRRQACFCPDWSSILCWTAISLMVLIVVHFRYISDEKFLL